MNERDVKRLPQELAYFDPTGCCSASSAWCSLRAGQNLVELNLVSTGAWSPQSLSWLVRRPELIPAATPDWARVSPSFLTQVLPIAREVRALTPSLPPLATEARPRGLGDNGR